MRKGPSVLSLLLCFIMAAGPASAEVNEITRLAGSNRYQTAYIIAENCYSGNVGNVVLVPGSSYANAFPAAVLAQKQGAPLLLLDTTAGRTQEAFSYLAKHMPDSGTVYLVGDDNLIGEDMENKLNQMGFGRIVRISGSNKYETDYKIAQSLQVPAGTEVVIGSGENFPDALAVSGFAAAKGWPVLLSGKEGLDSRMTTYLQEQRPEKIYIVGGTAVIPASVEEQIKISAPGAEIVRISGSDRYATAVKIAGYFAPDTNKVYFASGTNYCDALAGSILAAQTNSPLILVNSQLINSLPTAVTTYLQSINYQDSSVDLTILGGQDSISNGAAALISAAGSNTSIKSSSLEDEVITLVNKERADRGVSPLVKNNNLTMLARLKSQDMIANDYFDHHSPTYGDVGEMMKTYGISYHLWGENIAEGQVNAQEVMKDWMNSPGHRENILKEGYQEIGVGIAQDSYGSLIWTQIFRKK